MSEKKCAHPACNCSVPEDEKYCSQYCKDAGNTVELSCNCHHAGCVLEVAAGSAPAGAA
jgi:hypothetical protein